MLALLATQALACPFAGRSLTQARDDGAHNGMTEADVEARIRAALDAHGLDYDALTAPAVADDGVDGVGPHGATAPAGAAPSVTVNGRRLHFAVGPVAMASKAVVVNPNGTESKFAALAAGKNWTAPNVVASQIGTRFLNLNASLHQDDVVAKAVSLYSGLMTPANMALFLRMLFHEAGELEKNA